MLQLYTSNILSLHLFDTNDINSIPYETSYHNNKPPPITMHLHLESVLQFIFHEVKDDSVQFQAPEVAFMRRVIHADGLHIGAGVIQPP